MIICNTYISHEIFFESNPDQGQLDLFSPDLRNPNFFISFVIEVKSSYLLSARRVEGLHHRVSHLFAVWVACPRLQSLGIKSNPVHLPFLSMSRGLSLYRIDNSCRTILQSIVSREWQSQHNWRFNRRSVLLATMPLEMAWSLNICIDIIFLHDPRTTSFNFISA